jgi:uncharacterized membrane protein
MATLSSRSKSIFLFASIAINVLLASMIATQAIDKRAQDRDRTTSSRIAHLAERLPGPDGEKLRAAFSAHAKDLPTARTELKAARAAFRKALAADPYDRAEVEKSLAQLDSSRAKVRKIMRETVVTAAADMSAEGRKRLADSAKRR